MTPTAGEEVLDTTIVPPNNRIDVGDQIWHTLELTNATDAVMTDVRIRPPWDNRRTITCGTTSNGDRWANDGTDTLDPGETITCRATLTFTAADISGSQPTELTGLRVGDTAPSASVALLDGGTWEIGGDAARERPLVVYAFVPYLMMPCTEPPGYGNVTAVRCQDVAVEAIYLDIFESAYRMWGSQADFVAVGTANPGTDPDTDIMTVLRQRFDLTVPFGYETEPGRLWNENPGSWAGDMLVAFDSDNEIAALLSSHNSLFPSGDGLILDSLLSELLGESPASDR